MYGDGTALHCSSGAVDFLTAVHHSALCQQHLCKLLETMAGPVLDALRAKCWEADVQAQQLRNVIAEQQSVPSRQAAGVQSQPQKHLTHLPLTRGACQVALEHTSICVMTCKPSCSTCIAST